MNIDDFPFNDFIEEKEKDDLLIEKVLMRLCLDKEMDLVQITMASREILNVYFSAGTMKEKYHVRWISGGFVATSNYSKIEFDINGQILYCWTSRHGRWILK